MDINTTIGSSMNGAVGPLAKLNGSSFERTTLRYPIDLGSVDKGHYVVFYARVQKDTQYRYNIGSASDLQASTPTNYGNLGYPTTGIFSNPSNTLGGGGQGALGQTISKKGMPTRTVLTTDAIGLYMPDTILFQHEQSYDVLSPGTEFLGQMVQAGASVYDQFKQGGEGALKNSIMKNAILVGGSKLAQMGGSTGQLAFTAFTGTVVNPILEMIYRSPNFRSFQFDFMFYPRSRKEAVEVQNILERFKYHQSPEILRGAEGFLIPPSEFEIVFYYNGKQNPNIPPIATTVLTDINVNYAPQGWSAYEVPGETTPSKGGTGMPVATQLTLQFRETTYLTKEDYTDRSVGLTTLAP